MPGRNGSICAAILALVVIAGCSRTDVLLRTADDLANRHTAATDCHTVLRFVAQSVSKSRVNDAETVGIDGFPYLKASRFDAFIGRRFDGRTQGSAFAVWVDRLRDQHRIATRREIKNLPRRAFTRLTGKLANLPPSRVDLIRLIDKCGDQLRRTHLARSRARQRLVETTHVPDNYSDIARAFGLFPISSVPVAIGWENWKQKNLATFNGRIAPELRSSSHLTFVPAKPASVLSKKAVGKILKRSRNNPLQIPRPTRRELHALYRTFAPAWRIGSSSSFDQPGYPEWRPDAQYVTINTAKPTVFTRYSFSVIDDQIHLQLVYAIWFSERTQRGSIDLLAGHLDGVVWRVTLSADGRPLIYDSIHACGCYHLIFPTPLFWQKFQGRSRPEINEIPAVAKTLPVTDSDQQLVVHLASGSHYLTNIVSKGRTKLGQRSRTYRLVDADVLTSLPRPTGGNRSMYERSGLVAGTDRLERYLLWPMGIASAGAMRQWGTQAIAFTDRRHFDDPDLFHQIFGR